MTYVPPLGIPPKRRKVCHADLSVPHGQGHNAVCVCGCQWCREERAMLADGDLFTSAPQP